MERTGFEVELYVFAVCWTCWETEARLEGWRTGFGLALCVFAVCWACWRMEARCGGNIWALGQPCGDAEAQWLKENASIREPQARSGYGDRRNLPYRSRLLRKRY
jgi:hypothetical protein